MNSGKVQALSDGLPEPEEALPEPARIDPLAGLQGALSHLAPEKPVSVEAMNEAIRESARLRFRRSQR